MASVEQADWQREWHGIWDVLGCKWTFHVIRLLTIKECGFNEMKRELDGITSTMLSRRLKDLEEAGILSRRVVEESPPKTEYRLTESGHELGDILIEIEHLGPIDVSGNGE